MSLGNAQRFGQRVPYRLPPTCYQWYALNIWEHVADSRHTERRETGDRRGGVLTRHLPEQGGVGVRLDIFRVDVMPGEIGDGDTWDTRLARGVEGK